MKRNLYALMAALSLCTCAMAAPGDTTWVQATSRQFDNGNGYGAYDTAVSFPSGALSYRKIYMIFTLGEYACPGNPQYCHQWDYTIQNYIMTPTDTLELGRFITPFANSGTPRFPSTWSQRYVYDVTDFYPVLKNNARMRVFYSGYSTGFKGDIKFAFIEGTPERNVLGISRLWTGSPGYGNAANPIDNTITARTRTAPANMQSAELKFTITGHGSDANQCCEFASHNYQVKVNGNQVDQKTIWRDNCGSNELYAQGGTWIYDRGNWCPGATVQVNTHKLTGVTAGNSYSVDVDFDPYSVASPGGSYTIEGNVFYYGGYNHTSDASLEDVVAPSNNENYFRENPAGSMPVVRVRNTGSSTINSITFKYGVKDSTSLQYTWNGSLAPLHDTLVTLPKLKTLTDMSLASNSGVYQFVAQIVNVNGAADNDPTNDTIRSYFVVAPTWPSTFVINMKTNNEGVNGLNQSPSETNWQITDMANNVIASRTNADINTLYTDIVQIQFGGFYKLTVSDGGCDGLQWWVYTQNPGAGITAGFFTVKQNGSTTTIPLNGNEYGGTFNNDFGCGFVQYFTISGPTGVPAVTANNEAGIVAFPNPAQDNINITIYGVKQVTGSIELMDMTGRVVLRQQASGDKIRISTADLPSGLYQVIYNDPKSGRLQTRLAITK